MEPPLWNENFTRPEEEQANTDLQQDEDNSARHFEVSNEALDIFAFCKTTPEEND